MSRYTILVLVGSLRRDSYNRKLASAVAKPGPPEFAFSQSQIADMPQYNQDDDAAQAEPVRRLKGEIAAATGVLFVTPEYNRSIPGAIKNAIDHASRSYGRNAFAGKARGRHRDLDRRHRHGHRPAAFAQRSRLSRRADARPAEGFWMEERPVRRGRRHREGSRAFLQGSMDRYVAWVKQHAG